MRIIRVKKVRVSDEEMDANATKKMPHVKKAITSAKSVLSIFEKEYPGEKCSRKAIEAVEAWMKNPTVRNRVLAGKASDDLSARYATYPVAAYSAAALSARRAAGSAAYAALSAALSAYAKSESSAASSAAAASRGAVWAKKSK